MLSDAATILTERHRISSLEVYLRTVIGHMRKCLNDHGNAHVRIGVQGTGSAPNHKVVFDVASEERLFKAYSGADPFTGVEIQDRKTWSNARMSYVEVEDLLANVTGYTRPKV
jgi:hypothetical protein